MGASIGHVLQPGSAYNSQRVSDVTRELIMEVFDVLRANPRVTVQKIEGLLSKIPKVKTIKHKLSSYIDAVQLNVCHFIY